MITHTVIREVTCGITTLSGLFIHPCNGSKLNGYPWDQSVKVRLISTAPWEHKCFNDIDSWFLFYSSFPAVKQTAVGTKL